MRTRKDLEFRPDYAVPPGESLLEVLEGLGMTQAELAERTGRPTKTINEIIKGKAAITPETALQLERVLGVPARFWNNLERNYREALARQEERKRLASEVAWLAGVPVRALIQLGYIQASADKASLLAQVLSFFGVGSTEVWNQLWTSPAAAFRRSPAFQSSPGAVAAWLRIGELAAQKLQTAAFDRGRFRLALEQCRRLTREPFEVSKPRLIELCAAAGVAVVIVPELPKTRLFGATRWLTPEKALIQLSLRYKTADHLWFTFFHECGHILLHGKKEGFLEDEGTRDPKEDQADRFAEETLIPTAVLKGFVAEWDRSRAAIETFAEQLGIAPGIVVGRLQHDGALPYSHFHDLKEPLQDDGG